MMVRRLRVALNKLWQDQQGQTFILALILLTLGSLITVPLLTYMSTGIRTGQMYDRKKDELYAADAGIEDALWRIKYDHMPTGYKTYDFFTNWPSPTSQQVNDKDVSVTIQNVWIPKDVAVPTEATAKGIIETGKLMVVGSTIETSIDILPSTKISKYRIRVSYYPGASENLRVNTLGIWLPPGFELYTDSTHKSNLEEDLSDPYYKVAATTPWAANQAVLWSYLTPVSFTSFPNVVTGDFPMTMEVTFYFKPLNQSEPDIKPDAVAWITTSGVGDIPYSWDADVRVFKMTSVAADSTTVESYVSKAEVRKLQSAMAGDYYATGNSLLSNSGQGYSRTVWHDPSSAAVTSSNIPTDAEVAAAYLYWSGWKNDNSITAAFNDTCSNFNSWNRSGTSPYNNTSWDVPSGYFSGHYNTGGSDSYRYLTLTNPVSLSTYSPGAVTVSWDQWLAALSAIFSDTCTSSNFSNYWQNGGDWSYYNYYYRARHTSSSDSYRYLTHSQNLSSYSTVNVTVSWDWWTSSSVGANGGLDLYISRDGTNFDYKIAGFRGSKTSTEYQSYPIPANYLTSNFKMRFIVTGSSSDYPSGKYCYIDNISITPSYSTADGLDFAFSADGGSTWSGNIQAFRGAIGTSQPSSNNFTYAIPSQYITANFKLRFYLVGFSGSGQYCYLDNIKIAVMQADTGIVFKIDGGTGAKQVYLDGDGNPHQGTQELTASKTQVLRNYAGTSPHGYSYDCYRDVTALVRTYSQAPTPPATNYPGYATYWVGGVYSSTARDGQTVDEWAYANWSLIIIYTSAETQGHQLYLFDKFIYSNQNTQNGVNVDFDGDGEPGGTISSFIVPARTRDHDGNWEVNAAKITCYVGEGDVWYTGDYLAINGTKLWDGTTTDDNSVSNPDNCFNSTSMGFSSYDGIDIDTLGIDPPNGRYITWDSGILNEGDTSAHIDMVTHQDVWNLVYIILSFRSSTTTGGAINYLIR